jgi:two-component system NtrC family sensor kinase
MTAVEQDHSIGLGRDELWRTLLAYVQELVTLVDQDGRIIYASESVKQWLDLLPQDLIGSALADGSHPDDVAGVTTAIRDCNSGSQLFRTHRVRARDGSWRSFESRFVCLRDDPAVGGVLIVSRDVTERVALERERERLELDRRVSQRLEAVGQLAAGIAHEINTPLQFVGDSVTFLKEACDELLDLTAIYRATLHADTPIPLADRRRAMRDAEQQADVEYLCERIPAAFDRTTDGIARVRSIVQAMKRFSHATSTEPAPADLNEAIETTLAVCRNEYKYVADITLDLGELPPVTCQVSELNQVFLNLVLNAAQAIEEQVVDSGGRGNITITTRSSDSHAVIEVSDDGPGIPSELQDRIYEPFFTTKLVGKGTGQGLALARATIERHAGTLECSSSSGHGTRFTIRLPLQPGFASHPHGASR